MRFSFLFFIEKTTKANIPLKYEFFFKSGLEVAIFYYNGGVREEVQ